MSKDSSLNITKRTKKASQKKASERYQSLSGEGNEEKQKCRCQRYKNFLEDEK